VLKDLLLQPENQHKSILVLGPPGSGKTSVIREIARILSLTRNVCIVDTSNEICGDGDVPHSCVGDARRLMVTTLADQHNVMVECVQNHTPDVMVIDEIGRSTEASAARTCKMRGVRMIASAHGDFRGLMKNKDLIDLVGGIQPVTLGDELAKRTGSKLSSERCREPCFDIIVELRKGQFHEFRVINDVAKAVDASLRNERVKAQLRTRTTNEGIHQRLYFEFVDL
jgi:stage III sporulation protein SpoIIIAA